METTRVMLEVLDPSAEPVAAKSGLSPRLGSLAGKTVGVIWNGRPSGNRILHRVMDTLTEKHGLKEVVFREKPFLGNIAPAELLEELSRRCDAVVTGVGD